MTRRILALDTSVKNTGWAYGFVHDNGCHIQTGYKSFSLGTPHKVKKMELSNEGIIGGQALLFTDWVKQVISHKRPDEIVMERSFLSLNPGTEILIGLQVILMSIALSQSIPVTRYATTSLKSFALEKGYNKRYADLSKAKRSEALKAEMVEAMQKHTGDPTPVTNDEADAFWCLQLHLSKTSG